MALALRDHQSYTYADFLNWPDEMRYELINGEAFMMTPAPVLVHQELAGEIYRQAANALQGKTCRAYIAPIDVRLPQQDEADAKINTVVQPDVFVVCDNSKLDKRGIRGAPDWIVEVLSPATAGHDQIKKRQLYEQHGVREYWLVHPTDRLLTIYRLAAGEYGKPQLSALAGETPVGILPEIIIQWDVLVARLPMDD